MPDVNYLNPEALIQNTSAPQGSMGPDFLLAGRGPVQGYLQGQAANQSQDLLNMSKRQQEMNLTKQATELDEFTRLQPNRMKNAQSDTSIKESEARTKDFASKVEGFKVSDIEAGRRYDQSALLGNYAKYFNGDAMHDMAVHQEAINQFKKIYPGEDPGPEITQYDPQKTPEMFKHALEVGTWGQGEMTRKKALMREEGTIKSEHIKQQTDAERDMLKMKLDAERDIATAANTAHKDIAKLTAKQHPAYLAAKLFEARAHLADIYKEHPNFTEQQAQDQLSGAEQAYMMHDQDIIGMANPFIRQYAEAAGKTATIEGQLSGATQPGTGGGAVQKSMEGAQPRKNPFANPNQQAPAQQSRQPKTIGGKIYTPIPGTGKTGLPLYQDPEGNKFEIKE